MGPAAKCPVGCPGWGGNICTSPTAELGIKNVFRHINIHDINYTIVCYIASSELLNCANVLSSFLLAIVCV